MGRTKTKSKEMTLDCARDPGRTRTLISSSYWGCPVLPSRDPGITPNSRDAETNGQGTILEACNKIGYLGISS